MSGVLGKSLRPKGLLGHLAKDGCLVTSRGHGDQVRAVLWRGPGLGGCPRKGLLLSAEGGLEEDVGV